jgi:hypothetical protein
MTASNEAVEKLQQFVMAHALPKTDMALFGIKCPYCGKSDRIRQLESPDELQEKMDPEEIKKYSQLWNHLMDDQGFLGVCKFCHNPLKLSGADGKAEALYR